MDFKLFFLCAALVCLGVALSFGWIDWLGRRFATHYTKLDSCLSRFVMVSMFLFSLLLLLAAGM